MRSMASRTMLLLEMWIPRSSSTWNFRRFIQRTWSWKMSWECRVCARTTLTWPLDTDTGVLAASLGAALALVAVASLLGSGLVGAVAPTEGEGGASGAPCGGP